MRLNLRPYPEYKGEGLPWLKKLPIHWELSRAKTVFARIDQRSKDGKEELLSVSAKDGVRRRGEKAVTMFMAASYQGYKLCWPGDLVINSLWAWAKGLGFSQHHGIVSSAYGVYRPRRQYAENWRYLNYLLRSGTYDWELTVRSKGIWTSRLQMTDESFFGMPIVLPPPEEQQAIANFLANFDQRVNRLIRAKRRQIELLNEQKQAIIHRAVTRGLDPNVPLKPSGIDWLGDIPAHWVIRSVKQLLQRMDYGTSKPPDNSGDTKILSMAAIQSGQVTVPENCPTGSVAKALRLDHDDLLFNRTNSADLVGKVGIFKGDSTDGVSFASYLVRLRARIDCDPDWLNYVLNAEAFLGHARSQALLSLHQANLNSTRYGRMLLPAPSHQEQGQIACKLTSDLRAISGDVQSIHGRLRLVSEYRTRLIADVVTGQLDVRNHPWSLTPPTEPAIPDEVPAEDPELIEDLAHAD